MEIPDSMKSKLSRYTGGGIDLAGWISGNGTFELAVGYSAVFWPEFVAFEKYVLRKGFVEESLRGFEQQADTNRQSVEWVMNHLHIAELHPLSDDTSHDKLIFLGNVLREIHEAKLARLFPDRAFFVELDAGEPEDIWSCHLSFWQKD